LKHKCFGMRRRITGLKHLCDKNYNVAEDKMDSGGGGSDGGGGGRRSAGGGRQSAEGTDDGCGRLMAGGVMPQLYDRCILDVNVLQPCPCLFASFKVTRAFYFGSKIYQSFCSRQTNRSHFWIHSP
jgi:hypothetical protein